MSGQDQTHPNQTNLSRFIYLIHIVILSVMSKMSEQLFKTVIETKAFVNSAWSGLVVSQDEDDEARTMQYLFVFQYFFIDFLLQYFLLIF